MGVNNTAQHTFQTFICKQSLKPIYHFSSHFTVVCYFVLLLELEEKTKEYFNNTELAKIMNENMKVLSNNF